jgi:hypothetical protein
MVPVSWSVRQRPADAQPPIDLALLDQYRAVRPRFGADLIVR